MSGVRGPKIAKNDCIQHSGVRLATLDATHKPNVGSCLQFAKGLFTKGNSGAGPTVVAHNAMREGEKDFFIRDLPP